MAIALAIFPITPSQYTANILFIQVYEFRYFIAVIIFVVVFFKPIYSIPMIFIRLANISSYLFTQSNLFGAGLLMVTLIMFSVAFGFFASSASQLAYSHYRQIRYHGSDLVRQKLIQRANFFAATGNLAESNETFRIVLAAFPNDDRNNAIANALEHNLRMIHLSQALFAKGAELALRSNPKLGYDIVATGRLFWPKNPDIDSYLHTQRTQLAAAYAEELRRLQPQCHELSTPKAGNSARARLPYALRIALQQSDGENSTSEVDLVRHACELESE